MNVLVLGASGATGRLLVEQLLNHGNDVKAIVRSPDGLSARLKNNEHDRLAVIRASILELSEGELAEHVAGCRAVVSCLGHNMTFKGMFGQPRRLVTDATRSVCEAIKKNNSGEATKFVLMNTAGNSNRNLEEPISYGQRLVIGMLRLVLPPHADNEEAAEFLRTEIGPNDGAIEWVVVRPDSLVNEDEVTEYEIYESPTRSAIFNPGKTSRVNVGHFIAELINSERTWVQWKGQMPVIYNASS